MTIKPDAKTAAPRIEPMVDGTNEWIMLKTNGTATALPSAFEDEDATEDAVAEADDEEDAAVEVDLATLEDEEELTSLEEAS